MKLTPFQIAIANFVQSPTEKNLIVEAYAGCGKTSTIVAIAGMLPTNLNMLFLAFNKKIATELQERLPSHCTASTFHSFGMKLFPARVRVDTWKGRNAVTKVLGIDAKLRNNTQEQNELMELVEKIVAFAKSQAYIGVNSSIIEEYAEHFNADLNGFDTNKLVGYVNAILESAQNDVKVTDFDDMIYLPAINGWTGRNSYDFIFVDEAQDLNAAQIQMMKNAQKANPNCRFVFIGDPNQAIYGFRGAGIDTFPTLRREFECQTLPLPVSFRCGKAIIRNAQKFVPEMMEWEGASEGEVVSGANWEDLIPEIRESYFQSFILCRKNAPIVTFCYGLLRQGIAATIVGADVAKLLHKSINDIAKGRESLPLDRFAEVADAYIFNKVARLREKNMDFSADRFEELGEIFFTFISQMKMNPDSDLTVKGLKNEIDTLFAKDEGGNVKAVKLMTCHKSKGLEAPNVYIFDEWGFGRKKKADWEVEQETNLKYVAATRAQKRLVYFNIKEKENEE